jgi:pantoate kinase
LGTVSAIYRSGGAGAIIKPGAPGIAEFRNVPVKDNLMILTVCLEPMRKKGVILSEAKTSIVNKYGKECLERLLNNVTLDELALCGEYFTRKIGLASRELLKLIETAKRSGATYASQNMIGQAMHAIVYRENMQSVKRSLQSFGVEVKEYRIGTRGAFTITKL